MKTQRENPKERKKTQRENPKELRRSTSTRSSSSMTSHLAGQLSSWRSIWLVIQPASKITGRRSMKFHGFHEIPCIP